MSATTALDATTRRWLYATTALLLLPLLLQLQPMVGVAVGAIALLSMVLSTRGRLPALLKIALALGLASAVFSVYRQVGRDTGCALLAMMLALKPTETASVRDARSLLGYGLFAPFATYLLDQGPLSLVLGALAVAAALTTLLRLSDLDSGVDLAGWSPLDSLRAAGKLLLLALPLVLAAFWLFPRLASPLWGLPDRAVSKPGLSETMTPDRWMDALNDDTPAMRARFIGPAPRPQEMYWRAMTLRDFDGRTWTPAPSSIGAPKLSLAPTRWRYTLDVEPTDQRLLATLEFAPAQPDGTQRGRDAGLRAIAPLTGLTRWQLQAAPALSFDPVLDARERRADLALPPRNPRTLALGRQWRSEAGGNDVAIIERALAMIHEDFAYSLTVPEPGRDWIDDFLFEGRTGYCQQFSSAFVVLMRSAGIPARVVVGYAGGYHNPVGCARLGRSLAGRSRLDAGRSHRRGRAGARLRHPRRPHAGPHVRRTDRRAPGVELRRQPAPRLERFRARLQRRSPGDDAEALRHRTAVALGAGRVARGCGDHRPGARGMVAGARRTHPRSAVAGVARAGSPLREARTRARPARDGARLAGARAREPSAFGGACAIDRPLQRLALRRGRWRRTQGADPRAARASAVNQRPGAPKCPSAAPASRCRWIWNTVCPASPLQFITMR